MPPAAHFWASSSITVSFSLKISPGGRFLGKREARHASQLSLYPHSSWKQITQSWLTSQQIQFVSNSIFSPLHRQSSRNAKIIPWKQLRGYGLWTEIVEVIVL